MTAVPSAVGSIGAGTHPVLAKAASRVARAVAGPLGRHRRTLALLVPLLMAVAVASAVNLTGWPGRVNDDEGTYLAQAWAVLEHGALAHYTYSYDHPPLGWLTIAAYALLTDGFDRVDATLTIGRELMVLNTVTCAGLIFLLGRRLSLSRWAAGAAVALFAFTPIGLQYHRMVFLDNLALTWAVAAFALAASPRRSLSASVGSGLCFAAAVLTKETTALLLPPLLWLLIQHTDRRTRPWNLSVAGATAMGAGLFYPLYAVLKGELLVGDGHVSLLGAIAWQLSEREGSGSVFDPTSDAAHLVDSWLTLDPWLLLLAAAALPCAFAVRNLRPIALALLLQAAVMLRGGYLPYPYVICLLPFAALVVAGVGDAMSSALAAAGGRSRWRPLRITTLITVPVIAALAFALLPGQLWLAGLRTSTTLDVSAPGRDGTAWIAAHVPRDAVIIVDDYTWLDLAERGYTNQIWSYKADLDPEVRARLLPDGYASVDYVALNEREGAGQWSGLPTVAAAIENSTIVAQFGDRDLVIRKVITPPPG